ncbi:MAG: ABC transporter substrate-binding protein [Oscillospiraceae bacterium]|nr:ABC transporter substrate-binding protein [Oscillospiraceae bacterium]
MKKLLSFALGLSVLVAVVLTGCSSGGSTESGSNSSTASQTQTSTPVDMNVTALKGPTAMGMVKFMNDCEEETITDNNYNFSIAASIDEVTPKIVQGEIDIAAVPANVASVLYNNTEGGVKVLAINTLGVLYMVESGDTIHSAEDLRGKTIYASGKGATPEYALNYILEQNGIDPAKDVTIEWKSEHSECVAALNASENAIAMLPQPFVTTAQSKNSNLRVALDLTEEWDKLQENAESPSTLVTGVVVARTEFIEQNPQAVEDFLKHYQESVDYINNNVNEGAALVGKYDIVTEAVAQKAIPECNITFISGNEMKEKLSGYLSVLNHQTAKSIGGKLPADDFYYNA